MKAIKFYIVRNSLAVVAGEGILQVTHYFDILFLKRQPTYAYEEVYDLIIFKQLIF